MRASGSMFDLALGHWRFAQQGKGIVLIKLPQGEIGRQWCATSSILRLARLLAGKVKLASGIALLIAILYCTLTIGSTASADAPEDFLKFGRALGEQSHPLNDNVIAAYKGSLQKIEVVSDCTKPLGNEGEQVGAIDWKIIGSTSDFEVCIFRIARHYKSLSRFEQWIKTHLTTGVSIIDRPEVLMNIMNSSGTGALVSFDVETRGLPTGAFSFLTRLLSGVVSVGVTLDSNDLPINVQVVMIYK
jgi:hypothetical protein